jgi:hypothetical protein
MVLGFHVTDHACSLLTEGTFCCPHNRCQLSWHCCSHCALLPSGEHWLPSYLVMPWSSERFLVIEAVARTPYTHFYHPIHQCIHAVNTARRASMHAAVHPFMHQSMHQSMHPSTAPMHPSTAPITGINDIIHPCTGPDAPVHASVPCHTVHECIHTIRPLPRRHHASWIHASWASMHPCIVHGAQYPSWHPAPAATGTRQD